MKVKTWQLTGALGRLLPVDIAIAALVMTTDRTAGWFGVHCCDVGAVAFTADPVAVALASSPMGAMIGVRVGDGKTYQ